MNSAIGNTSNTLLTIGSVSEGLGWHRHRPVSHEDGLSIFGELCMSARNLQKFWRCGDDVASKGG